MYCYYGPDGPEFDSRQKQPILLFSNTVQTGFEDQPASRSVGSGVLPRGVKLTIYPYLVSRLKMSGVVTSPLPMPSWCGEGHLYL